MSGRSGVPMICVNALRGCVLAAANAGLQPLEVASLVGIDPSILGDPDARVPARLAYLAWDQVSRRVGDPCFGLHAAEAMDRVLFDAFDYAVVSAPTLGDAIAGLRDHMKLQNDGAEIQLSVADGVAQVAARFYPAPRVPWQLAEFAVAVWTLRARRLVTDFRLLDVRFRHAPPAANGEYARLFGVPARFRAPVDCVRFDASLLGAAVRSADAGLHNVMVRYVEQRAQALPPPDPEAAAHHAIETRLRERGLPRLPTIARALGMSVRALQRSLLDRGTSFQELLDRTRRELALEWAADAGQPLSAVAGRLGFGDAAAFSHAFRRWTGEAPSAWRRRQRGAGPE